MRPAIAPLLRRQTIEALRTTIAVQTTIGNVGAAETARNALIEALDKPVVADQLLHWRAVEALELARDAGRDLAAAQTPMPTETGAPAP